MLSNGASHLSGGWRGEVKGITLEINFASCSILPRIRTTLSRTPCNHGLVSRRQAVKKAVYFSLLSALLDKQLVASILYFKTKTSLLLYVHISWRELSFILSNSDMMTCRVALGLGVGFLRTEWSAQRERGSLGNKKFSGASGALGVIESFPETWLWALNLEVPQNIFSCRVSEVAYI